MECLQTSIRSSSTASWDQSICITIEKDWWATNVYTFTERAWTQIGGKRQVCRMPGDKEFSTAGKKRRVGEWDYFNRRKRTSNLHTTWRRQIEEPFYHNSRSSALIFEARLGRFRTWSYKKKFNHEYGTRALLGKINIFCYMADFEAGTIILPESV